MYSKTYSITPNLAISASGFLFLTSTGETFTTNETGQVILGAMQSGASEDELCDRVMLEFDVDRRSAQCDVQDFLAQLRQFCLLAEKDNA